MTLFGNNIFADDITEELGKRGLNPTRLVFPEEENTPCEEADTQERPRVTRGGDGGAAAASQGPPGIREAGPGRAHAPSVGEERPRLPALLLPERSEARGSRRPWFLVPAALSNGCLLPFL